MLRSTRLRKPILNLRRGFVPLRSQRFTGKARRNIYMMNAMTIFRNALFIIAVIMPFAYFKANITAGQLITVQSIFAIALVIFGVPSGWLADVWTRKKTMIVGLVLELLGFSLMATMHGFWQFVIAEVVIAAGLSMISGTISAMLYDTLVEIRMTRHYRRLEGLRHGLGMYAVGCAGLLSGVFFAISPNLVMGLTLLSISLSVICGFFLYEPDRVKEAVHKNPFADIVQAIKYGMFKNPYIGRLTFFIAILFGVTNTAFWTQQPYYMSLDIPIIWYGFLGAGGHLTGGLAAHVSHLLTERLKQSTIFLLALIWLTMSYAVSGFFPHIWGVFLLMSGAAFYGFLFPVVQDEVNKHVSAARRATILSCVSLSSRLVFSVLGVALGAVMDQENGVYDALLILALILTIAALPAWVLLARYNPDRSE